MSHPKIQKDHWYVFSHEGAFLHPSLQDVVRRHAALRPDVEFFYGDEVVVNDGGTTTEEYYFKPCFDETQLIAQDYIGSPLLVKSSALEMLGSSERDAGTAFTYDLLLRALSAGLAIERIPEVLAARSKPPSRGAA